jgi:hypothetical protein
MIEISEELRNHFLTDSTTNNLVVDARIKGDGSVDYTNFYTGDVETYSEVMSTRSWDILANRLPEAYSFKDYVDMRYFANRTYFSISFNIHIQDITSLPEYLNIALYWRSKDGVERFAPLANAIRTSEYVAAPKRFVYIGNTQAGLTEEIEYFNQFNVNVPDGEADFIATITISDLQIELGNDVAEFPRNYDVSLNNDDVVFESFTYKESLCSKDNLKFGLCEASNAEFSIMNDNHVLNDARLKLYIQDKDHPYDYSLIRNINWHNDASGYMRPNMTYTQTGVTFGWTNKRLFDTDITPYADYFSMYGHIKITLDFKIDGMIGDAPDSIRIRIVRHDTDGNQVNYTLPTESVSLYSAWKRVQFNVPYMVDGKATRDIERIYIFAYNAGQTYTVDYSIRNLGIYIANEEDKDTPAPAFDPDMCLVYNDTLDEYSNSILSRVPMGMFHVTGVKKKIEHLLEQKTVTAYDYIIRLEQNAADWYTQYMFGLSFIGYNGVGFEYARQIYSSFFDYMRKIGLDYRDNYDEELVASYTKAEILASHLSSKRLKYADGQHFDFRFAEFNVNAVTSRRYCVLLSYDNSIGAIKQWCRDYYDPLFRGVLSANILIEETRANHPNNKYVVDSGDYFMVSEDCTSFKVYVICYFEDTDNSSVSKQIINSVTITKTTTPIDLENGAIRLLYYDWNTQEIFPCETSITGRDVVRSLLEPCGCLFRLNRETNIPEFVYCTKGGLYPAENLYPADDLYPRSGTDTMLSTGKYMSFERGENEVQNFGRIQIKKGGSTNETEPICQWEYIGDTNEVNTYIIDDNIFYCAENMVYSPGMIEVSEMLEKMWYRISNMGYVSNITTALGMPWIECGDRIGILTMVGGAETFIFRRTLKGIQMLTDTYESNGDEYVKAISNYNYGG